MRCTGSALRLASLLALALAVAGCSLDRPFFVTDTEGWTYRVPCRGNACGPVIESPYAAQPSPACTGGARPGFAVAGRTVLVACHACVSGNSVASVTPERCRPLRCSGDPECPPRHGGAQVRCVHGLCQVPSQHEFDLPAVAGLCMAGAGPSGLPGEAEAARMSMARAACSSPSQCAASPTCRAP